MSDFAGLRVQHEQTDAIRLPECAYFFAIRARMMSPTRMAAG
jgi:hypothetical protein